MGVWIIAAGKLDIEPEVNDYIIQEFIIFSKVTCPPDYYREKFGNPWFFDAQNKLVCHEGKFAEPIIWFDHLKENFFKLWEYDLIGDPHYLGEGEIEYQKACKERNEEYKKWIERSKEIENNQNLMLQYHAEAMERIIEKNRQNHKDIF